MATAIDTRKSINDEQQQELDQAFERARKALAVIETYDQARVDRLCQAVAWAVANKRTFTRLVEMGIEESGLGDAVSRMLTPASSGAVGNSRIVVWRRQPPGDKCM